MPKNTPMATPPAPQTRAIMATAIVVVILAIVAGVSFWYGRQGATNTNSTAANNPATADGTSTAPTPTKEAAIVGTVKQVLDNGIELTIGTGETSKTVMATISSTTNLRKLDYRNVPKQGLGDGVVISKGDIKTGATVVVRTADASTTKIAATKVSLLIYR